MGVVQTMSLDQLQSHLAAIKGVPRVVVGGNATTPWLVLDAIDRSIERYRLYQLNSPVGIPVRSGVIAETSFVGPGMRHHPALQYVPSRLSMFRCSSTGLCRRMWSCCTALRPET